MQHNRAGRKLGRTTAHRRALFRNQISSLVKHERITTTLHKAKELRPLAEKLVTLGKRGGLHARRLALKQLPDADAVQKLFGDLAKRFETRKGGYTRILKLGRRQGDGAETALIEFVDFDFAQRRAEKVAKEKAASEKKETLLEKAKRLVTGRSGAKPEAAGEKADAAAPADEAPAKEAKPAKKEKAPKAEKPAKAPRAPKAPKAEKKGPTTKGGTPRKMGG